MNPYDTRAARIVASFAHLLPEEEAARLHAAIYAELVDAVFLSHQTRNEYEQNKEERAAYINNLKQERDVLLQERLRLERLLGAGMAAAPENIQDAISYKRWRSGVVRQLHDNEIEYKYIKQLIHNAVHNLTTQRP